MRKSTAILLLISSVFIAPAYAKMQYIPNSLEHFKQTKECMHCDLSEAELRWQHYDNANLAGALLARASLYGSTFYSSNFDGSNLVGVEATSLKASGSSFKSANLSEASFNRANLSSCDFSNANVANVNFAYANLARAIISKEQLNQVKSLKCAIMPDGHVNKKESESC